MRRLGWLRALVQFYEDGTERLLYVLSVMRVQWPDNLLRSRCAAKDVLRALRFSRLDHPTFSMGESAG